MRRLAASLRGRRQTHPDLAQRLHDVLPLRYPADPSDPTRDPLTGLGSQLQFVRDLAARARRFDGDGSAYSLVLIDIDYLASINASRGWVIGDEILARMAVAMLDRVPPSTRSYRIGGDEFAMLLPGVDAEDAAGHAARCLEALEQPSGDVHPATFSAAAAGTPATSREPGLLYRQAAAALADVKRHGRSGVTVFDPQRHTLPGSLDPSGAHFVEQVVETRSLRPVFQPIVDLRTGHVLGYEGLVRLDTGGEGQGTRDLFAAAAAAGRVTELDLACLEVVVEGARAIRSDHLLTLNLAPGTLAGRDFEPAWLLQSLVQAGISPSRVIVELSDHELVGDLGRLQRSFAELQRFGLRVAADDVSVDDPARRLMTHVPFDIVKIDLSRIWEGARSGPRLALLRDVALDRHARVVAEGVETAEQLVAIRDLEFGAGQGYLLGRPDASVVERVVDVHRLEAEGAARAPWTLESDADDPLSELIPLERLSMFAPPATPALTAEPGRP